VQVGGDPAGTHRLRNDPVAARQGGEATIDHDLLIVHPARAAAHIRNLERRPQRCRRDPLNSRRSAARLSAPSGSAFSQRSTVTVSRVCRPLAVAPKEIPIMRTRKKIALGLAAAAVLAGAGGAVAATNPVGGQSQQIAAPASPTPRPTPVPVSWAPHPTPMPAGGSVDLPEPGDVPDGPGQ
jgi:hypothetical protein